MKMRTFFTSPALNMTCQISPVLSLPVAMNSGPGVCRACGLRQESENPGEESCSETYLMIQPSLHISLNEKAFPSFERSLPFPLCFSDHVVHLGLTCTGSMGGSVQSTSQRNQ